MGGRKLDLRYFKCFNGRKKRESSKENNGVIAVFVRQRNQNRRVYLRDSILNWNWGLVIAVD